MLLQHRALLTRVPTASCCRPPSQMQRTALVQRSSETIGHTTVWPDRYRAHNGCRYHYGNTNPSLPNTASTCSAHRPTIYSYSRIYTRDIVSAQAFHGMLLKRAGHQKQDIVSVSSHSGAWTDHCTYGSQGRQPIVQRTHDEVTRLQANGSINPPSIHGRLRLSPSPLMRAPHGIKYIQEARPLKQCLLDTEHCVHSLPQERFCSLSKLGSGGDNYENDHAGSNLGSLGEANSAANRENDSPRNQPPEGSASQPNSKNNEQEGMFDSDSISAWKNESKLDTDGETGVEVKDGEEQHTPLPFQIPPGVLRAAMSASPSSAGSFYSYALYRDPENQRVPVHYCHSIEIAERVAKYFLEEKVVGFDIEWKPFAMPNSIKENASLIQVACDDRIALFHIALYKGTTGAELLPPTLRIIIESQEICKVGVAIKGDFSRLEKYLDVKAAGVFELSRLHNLVEHFTTDPAKSNSKKLFSLAKQVQQHLQLPLSKGSVRESDWSQPLTHEQKAYAATDAYAGFRIFDVLESKRKKLRPIPPIPLLCDYDAAPRLQAAPRTKPAHKAATVVKKSEDVEVVVETPSKEEDDSGKYQSAAEEFMDSHELEATPDSEPTVKSVVQIEDPDTDCVPPDYANHALDTNHENRDIYKPSPYDQRVGRVNFSALAGSDPSYATLPKIPLDEESGSDSDPAFDPLVTRPRRRIPPSDTKQGSWAPENNIEMKYGTEEEVSEEQLSLEIAKQSSATEAEPAAEDARDQSAPSPSEARHVLEKNEDSEWTVEPEASTAKAPKRKLAKPTDASQTPHPSIETTAVGPLKFTPLPADTTPRSPEYALADTWAQSYLTSTIPAPSSTFSSSTPSRYRATMPHLRAYHLWHHQHLGLEVIAGHLRDPPLAVGTVSSYILQAVVQEKLEYRAEDMKTCLRSLPRGLRVRWKWMVDKVGGID